MLDRLPHLQQWDEAMKCSLLSVMLTRRETSHRRFLSFSLFFSPPPLRCLPQQSRLAFLKLLKQNLLALVHPAVIN